MKHSLPITQKIYKIIIMHKLGVRIGVCMYAEVSHQQCEVSFLQHVMTARLAKRFRELCARDRPGAKGRDFRY